MIHMNYMIQFTDMYNEIYKLISKCSCKFVPNTLDYTLLSSQIKHKMNEFHNLQSNYLDVIETSLEKKIIFESVDWENYINIVESDYNYLNLNIKFYVDHPNLNEYGIIIQERNYEQHYKFIQNSSNITNQKIKLTNNIHIIINDEIIDEIRKGQTSNNGRIKISYNANQHHLLRIPFHHERLYITNVDWVNSVITSMEIEYENFLNFKNKNEMKEMNTTYYRNLDNTKSPYSKTNTYYNR